MEKDSALEANAPLNILNYVSGYKVKLVVKEKIVFFLHDTLPNVQKKKVTMEKETKLVWQERQLLVKHIIKNMEVYFCLNFDDLVKENI